MRQDFHIAFAQGRNQRDKGESPLGERFEVKAGHTTRKLVENYGFIYSCNFSGQIPSECHKLHLRSPRIFNFRQVFSTPPFCPSPQENLAPGYAPAFALNLEISSEMSLNIKVYLVVSLLLESYDDSVWATYMKNTSRINPDFDIPCSDNDVLVLEFLVHNHHK